jgi:predicted amidohydrolase
MSSFTVTGRCVAVSPRSEDIPTLVDDVRDAVAFAEQQHAAVLVLPELYLPDGALKEIQDLLGLVGRGSYPALTILGLAHQAVEEMWRNEAVVLDYTGRELWRYRKVAPFVTPQGIGECLKTGDRIILRSTPAGWFTTVICVDLFAVTPHQALEMAAPSLVLVPSLSPSTTAHLKAAVEVKVRGSACVVANRPLDVRRAVAPSFHTFGRDAVLLPDPSVADWAPAGHVR